MHLTSKQEKVVASGPVRSGRLISSSSRLPIQHSDGADETCGYGVRPGSQ